MPSINPLVYYYPSPEPPSSSKPPRPLAGSMFFDDVSYSIGLVSNLFLYGIDKPYYLTGLAIGFLKPSVDYLYKGVVPELATYQINEQHVGDVMTGASSSKGPDATTKKLTYLFCVAAPIAIAYAAKETNPAICHAITLMLSIKSGFNWAQRTVQWMSPTLASQSKK